MGITILQVSHASRNRLFIDQALADMPPLPRPACEVRHVSTLIGLVENGLGVAIVPQLTLPHKPAAVAFAELLTQASKASSKGLR